MTATQPAPVSAEWVTYQTAAVRLNVPREEVKKLIAAGLLRGRYGRYSLPDQRRPVVVLWIEHRSLIDLEHRLSDPRLPDPMPGIRRSFYRKVEVGPGHGWRGEPEEPAVLYGLLTAADATELARRVALKPHRRKVSTNDRP